MGPEEYAREERERIAAILAEYQIDSKRAALLEPIIENVAWMKAKLDEARDSIKQSKVVIAYDNGGGQKGIRENPLFKGYEALWKSYMSGMSKIIEILPEPEKVVKEIEDAKPSTVLELVRAKHKVS